MNTKQGRLGCTAAVGRSPHTWMQWVVLLRARGGAPLVPPQLWPGIGPCRGLQDITSQGPATDADARQPSYPPAASRAPCQGTANASQSTRLQHTVEGTNTGDDDPALRHEQVDANERTKRAEKETDTRESFTGLTGLLPLSDPSSTPIPLRSYQTWSTQPHREATWSDRGWWEVTIASYHHC